MKKLPGWLLAGLSLAPAVLSAAVPFEGRVSFRMTSGGKTQDIRYAIKGERIRIEMPGQAGMGGMIMDTSKKEMIMLMDEQRMYMAMAMPDTAPGTGRETGEAPTLEKTGETEQILGHTAEKFISTHQGTKTEMWLAEGLGTYAAFSDQNPGGGRKSGVQIPQGWMKAIAGKPLFPLRVVGRDKAGRESFRMETTALDRQPLPDSLFTPPADYQRMDMGGMMRGMMPGMPRR
ncbi:MAG: DUF4412 domain-containing protein [Opitutus sp.]